MDMLLRFWERFRNGSGTVPERFRGRASPLLSQSTRTEARSRRTTAAKRNKSSFFRTYKCLQRVGVTTCSLSSAQREKLNVRERVKLDVEFAKIKDTFLHTSKSRSLDLCSVPSQFCKRILIERESIFER